VDTGTTLILIATDAYQTYMKKTGAVLDGPTGLLRINNNQFKNLKSLYFNTGGVSYELTPNAQIWPRAMNKVIGGVSENVYLIVNNIGTESGQGLDFINGYAFLQRYYSVYDADKQQVGFATTPFTYAKSN